MSDASPDRTPQSAQLPGNAPSRTKRIVTTLVETAGPTTSARLASRLGVQLTGRVATELASAKQYGFITLDEADKLIVTERGETFVGDNEEAALEAARDGVMSTAFGPIVKKLMTRSADASIVALRFEEDQGLSPGPAKNRAEILIKAAEEAKLISDGRFDAEPIEDTVERVGEVTLGEPKPKPRPKPETLKAETPKTAGTPIEKPKAKLEKPKRQEIKEEDGHPFVQAPSMQVVLQIDASKLTAEEIVTIAKELKGIGSSTVSS